MRFDYVFTYLGETFSTADEAVDLSGLKVGNARVDEVRALAGYLTACRELTMERCNVGNEQMAALRDAAAGDEGRVARELWQGQQPDRCDAHPAGQGRLPVFDEGPRAAAVLRGRGAAGPRAQRPAQHRVRAVHAKLRVAILAIGYLEDLTPLEGCTQLEYLELFTTASAT